MNVSCQTDDQINLEGYITLGVSGLDCKYIGQVCYMYMTLTQMLVSRI